LTEIGPLYDWPNKTVIPRSKMPHPRGNSAADGTPPPILTPVLQS
jgi:hypothetical protein